MAKQPAIFHTHFTSDPVSIASTMVALLDCLGKTGVAADDLGSMEIVMLEAINNIVEHAYLYCPDKPIELLVRKLGQDVAVELTDSGAQMPGGILPKGAPANVDVPVDQLPEGGFGWYLIRTLSKDLHYCREGNENRLTFSVTTGD